MDAGFWENLCLFAVYDKKSIFFQSQKLPYNKNISSYHDFGVFLACWHLIKKSNWEIYVEFVIIENKKWIFEFQDTSINMS